MRLRQISLILLLLGGALEAHAETVTAKSFRIEGSRAFSEATLRALVEDAKGKALSDADREKLALRITDFYHRRGYLRAHAILPEQNFKDGVIRFYITTRTQAAKPPVETEAAKASPAKSVEVKVARVTVAPANENPVKIEPKKVAASGGARPQNEAAVFFQRAKDWENRGREDLARGMLEKLFLISPDNPDGLAEMGMLELKRGNNAGAEKMLAKLQKVAPSHPGVARIQDLLRLNGPDKERLREARLLAKSGRTAEAVAAFRNLYPNGPPDNDLALEYWLLVASTPDGWEPARQALEKLARDNPDNLRFRLALAKLETSKLPLNRRALEVLIDLSKSPDYGREARAAWRNAVSRLDDAPEAIPLLRDYLAQDPADTAMKEQLASALKAREARARAAEERKKLLADPNYQAELAGLSLLEAGKLDEADAKLGVAVLGRPQDADAWGGMGLLRLRQGHQAEALAYFEKALAIDPARRNKWRPLVDTARFWLSMRMAGEARAAGEYGLAEEKLALAMKIKPDDPDALASLGRTQYAAGKIDEAEASFKRALRREADNGSALSGLFSLYLGNKRLVEAKGLFSALNSKQKVALGDSLPGIEAGILSLEGDSYLAAGRTDEALASYQRALKINPDDPWLVYSLAKLYAKSGKNGEALFKQYLARHPDDATGLYALALFQSGQDRERDALATLDKIPRAARNEKIDDFANSLRVRLKLLAAKSGGEDAKKALAAAEREAASDPELMLSVARGWADINDSAHAAAILAPFAAKEQPLAWHFAYADFLLSYNLVAELDQEIARLSAMKLSGQDAAQLSTLREAALVKKSDTLRLAGKLDDARLVISYPLTQSPDSVPLLLENAKISVDAKMWEPALSDFRHVLRIKPGNAEAVGGLLVLYVKTKDIPAARQLVADLSSADLAELAASSDQITRTMRQSADELLAAGNGNDAAELLRLAIAIDRDDPWLRYDLARILAKSGAPEEGDRLFSELLARHPGDATDLYVYALYQSGQDREVDALKTLEGIKKDARSEKIVRFQKGLWVDAEARRARAYFSAGDTRAAAQVLADAEKTAGSDAELQTKLALAWADIGNVSRARKILSSLAEGERSAGWHIDYAGFLLRYQQRDEFSREAARISQLKLTPDDAARFEKLKETDLIGRSDELRTAGRLEEARRLIAPELTRHPASVGLLLADARISVDAKMWARAEESYRRALVLAPLDSEVRHGLSLSLENQGKLLEALGQDEKWIADRATDDTETRLSLVRVLAALDDGVRANAELSALMSEYPEDSEVQKLSRDLAMQDARTLSRLRRVASASGPELQVIAPDPGAPPPGSGNNYQYRKAAEALDSSGNWVLAAADWKSRAGTPGVSQLDLMEIPIEWQAPAKSWGRPFAQANVVSINAGTANVNTPSWQAQIFGSLALCMPNCPSTYAGQSERALSLTAGVGSENYRVDVGASGLGFPVENVVGGILLKGDLGPLGVSLDLSRRPITSSLLSYAGTRDPRTGQVWGGVVATGPKLGFSLDQGGEFGAWSTLGFHRLTGQNVQSNDRMQLMAGGYWRIVNEEDQLFSLGLTGMYWRYKRDAGEYTFGHGGYYSPQRYASLSVPLSWAERFDRLSYSLRGAVSFSQSRFDAAPYFPTNAVYQTQSGGLFYAASSGPGRGYSFTAAAEYQADPALFLGGKLELERSPYYAPNSLSVYLRTPLDRAAAKPVPLQPEPVEPASQY